MRLRNVKNMDEIFTQATHYVEDAKKYCGKVETLFPKKQPLHIEIGMGKGDFIIQMAQLHPEINFIGIEKFDKVLARALPKIPDALSNLKIYKLDAREIASYFQKEVDKIYLNFSDPWPKARQAKHRLTSPFFLEQYDQIFKGDAVIEMKTDNVALFLYSLEILSQHGYSFSNLSLDYHKLMDLPKVMSEYEKKFTEKGIPICYVTATSKKKRGG